MIEAILGVLDRILVAAHLGAVGAKVDVLAVERDNGAA
jgi:hypothetical protein